MDCKSFKKLYPQVDCDDRNEFAMAYCRGDDKMLNSILEGSGMMAGKIYHVDDLKQRAETDLERHRLNTGHFNKI